MSSVDSEREKKFSFSLNRVRWAFIYLSSRCSFLRRVARLKNDEMNNPKFVKEPFHIVFFYSVSHTQFYVGVFRCRHYSYSLGLCLSLTLDVFPLHARSHTLFPFAHNLFLYTNGNAINFLPCRTLKMSAIFLLLLFRVFRLFFLLIFSISMLLFLCFFISFSFCTKCCKTRARVPWIMFTYQMRDAMAKCNFHFDYFRATDTKNISN